MPSRGLTIRSQGHSTPRDIRSNHDNRELYVQICTPGPDGAIHWMIAMRYPGSDRCTRLHSTGCIGDRRLDIEHGKRFDSRSVEHTHFLGKICERDSTIVEREARKIPLQSCQLWACYLILRLERRGLLEKGSYNHYMHCYEHILDEDYGPGHDGLCPIHGH
ncbi:hypothetical protein PDIG_46450 [Penicillium digitatum PHI26]|uniref:Uncharacterized protein n=2 Tax=Penicillium digitatum TaxID=36651 RepID=K9GB59_PEND2|nr:hypothetical protein PDIP_18370 [Penicillium digitatum Pd1]EKV12133.1 hypothetical protein PDIG_46450 [Penicillium digitatum PHI26]EKV20245.1 hypothetical protein PDIP_18370 [Penicillium digitatum Pd1]